MLSPIRNKNERHAPRGGGKGRHLWPRLLSRRSLENKTSYELSWKGRVMIKNKEKKRRNVVRRISRSRIFDICYCRPLACVFFFAHLLFYLRTFPFSFSLPSRSSDPGSLSRLFSPLPTTVHAFFFIARLFQLFLSSSTRIELCLPTLGGWWLV